ncbi:MAG: MerR family transcriptional regulator [Candidatus Hydrogenedentota bacterium]|nr:MAG: MerR family transcriptional regulator [Candidatus Hydrogenedentota bacterium]
MTEKKKKLYFTIGEVARILGLKPHVLRYWEEEFPSLNPRKDDAGRRVYRRRDIEEIIRIRELLYERKFTIAGARRVLLGVKRSNGKKRGADSEPEKGGDALGLRREELKRDLEFVLALLRER